MPPPPGPQVARAGVHAMLAAWRARRPSRARRREAENQPPVARRTDRCLCSLRVSPHWKGRLDPNRLNPQRSTGSRGTFAILGFYWLLKAFSCIHQLGCLIKYAFFCPGLAHIRGYFPVLPSPPFKHRSSTNASIQRHPRVMGIYRGGQK